jgi:hypothetical protein
VGETRRIYDNRLLDVASSCLLQLVPLLASGYGADMCRWDVDQCSMHALRPLKCARTQAAEPICLIMNDVAYSHASHAGCRSVYVVPARFAPLINQLPPKSLAWVCFVRF